MSDNQPTIVGVDPAEFDADKASETLRKAMKGFGTDERQIIKVLTEHNNAQRQVIKARYKQMYGMDLIENLKDELSGFFETLCLYLLMPSGLFDAFCLRNAMERVGTKETYLIDVLVSRSNDQIKACSAAYQETFQRNLENDIVEETSGDFQRVLRALVQGGRDESLQVDDAAAKTDAVDLYDAGEGTWGTDEGVFNRILVTKNQCHLQKVFEEYQVKAGRDIDETIKREFSGDTEKAFAGIVQYMKNPKKYFAKCLFDSMAGLGTDDERLMQLIVSHSEVDLKSIAEVYQQEHKKKHTLAEDIRGDTSGDYRTLLLRILDPHPEPYLKQKGGAKD